MKAPLLLLPVRLERGSVRSGFTLIQGDDEPRFNLTLLEMLRKDYGLTSLDSFATELPTDGHGLDVSGIWRTVQTAIKDIPGWEVSPTVALGSFSFAKYLMWKDLCDHEKLIVFANHRYYGGKLVTFPSACTEDTSITLHTVDGVYERGASRTNPIEARALVADVVALLRSPECRECGWSVGIVTFNTQQQQLIEDLLDAARRGDPSLEPFFAADREEPVIVKNLENIQGDERDIMPRGQMRSTRMRRPSAAKGWS